MNDKSIFRRQRQITEAEGYSTLGLFRQALDSLDLVPCADRDDFEYQFRRGIVLKDLERHVEALESLEHAQRSKSDDVSVLMALAWCYKRTNQIDRAIASTEAAYQISPKSPILLYNLACYWSLAGNKGQCLRWLGQALRMDRSLLFLIPDETDFDPVRSDPDFRKLIELTESKPSP